MQEIMNQAIHVGEAVIGADDTGDVQLELCSRRDRLRQQIFEVRHFGRGIARQQRQQEPVLVAEVIFYQRRVDAGLLGDVAQGDFDRRALDHQFARRHQQLLGGSALRSGGPRRYAGIQL